MRARDGRRDGYRPPRWLRGPHLQTIWPATLAPKPPVRYVRERWDTPDGDFIEIDLLADDPPRGAVHTGGSGPLARHEVRPFVVLFHGLEGDSDSHYARSLMAALPARGWRGAVAHFRGCGGAPNRLPRAYHSGDSEEIDWILRRFAAGPARGAPLHAVGVSLGGNALLKWLGERGESAAFVRSAAAVSPPQDLAAGAAALARGFNRVYTANFLVTLKRKSLAQLDRHPGLFDRERVLAARDFFDFDDAVTAPLHGFAGAQDYWRRSSCKPFLRGIRVPTAIVHAYNDPFLPAGALAGPAEVSAAVRLDYSAEGGHVGFATGVPPGRLDWLPARLLEHLDPEHGDG
ncbi:YheT family hydrolase [Zeimonas arvi]|uniref:Alpha/beta fold hydrolase n=1 Tax=Zeimonas arvi TaxID=2498847 RepID=A0A5C8P6G3_9BURK|nr:alpha/beta fold hydrolase [Zeimonas arvi]TXL68757.1 alpha/beta fold hydrolase [Zeimonas arvi]